MRGRYASFLLAEALRRTLRTVNPLSNLEPSWNVASTQSTPVVCRHPRRASVALISSNRLVGVVAEGDEGTSGLISRTYFPPRKSNEAHQADEELIEVLRQLLQEGEDISVRAVVRRMHTIGQPSTVTRDMWRMMQIAAHQIAQEHSRQLSAPVPQNEKTDMPEGGSIAHWPEFRELRCFLAAARTGNLGQAGRELTLSQPGVTRQIRKIEDRLGIQLFVRHGRGVTLTSAGSRLFDRLEPVVRLLSLPLELVPEPASGLGLLSIALPPEVGSLIGASFVEQAQAIWPNIKIEIHSGISSSLLEWILNGRAEIGIILDAPAHDGFHIQPVLRESLGLVIGPTSTLAESATPLRFRDLASLPLVLTSPRHSYRKVVISAGSRHGVDVIPKIEIDNIPMIKAIVNEGVGYAILPAMTVQDEIAQGRLLYRRIEQPNLSTTLSIVFRRETASILIECASMLRAQMTAPRTRAKWPDSEII